MYFERVIFYDVIPLLTLSSSCLSLLVNIIGKLYRFRDYEGKTFSKSLDGGNENNYDLVDDDKKSEFNDKSTSDTIFYEEKDKNPYYPVYF